MFYSIRVSKFIKYDLFFKEIKKKFSYFNIMAITSSNTSNEFILHLNSSHD